MIPARLRPENAAAFKHFVDSKIIIVQKWQKQNKTNRKTKYKPYYWNVSRAEVKYKYRKKNYYFYWEKLGVLLMSETIHHGIILKYSNNIFPF